MGVSKEQEFLKQVSDSQGIVHKVCRIYIVDEEERKDLFQEIMIHLWKSYSTFRGDSKFSSWMYRVSLNVAIQHHRKKKRKFDEISIEVGFLNIAANPTTNLIEEKEAMLYSAIGTLNTIEKGIMLLHLEEKSNEEISSIVGITQNNVRVKMNRIRNKLKEILKPQFDGN